MSSSLRMAAVAALLPWTLAACALRDGSDSIRARSNPRWALDHMRIEKAWALIRERPGRAEGLPGAGVIIAQADTGVTDHPELQCDGFLREEAVNFLEGPWEGEPNRDVQDPLVAGFIALHRQPGHGTQTSSLIISPESGQVTGVAPGAKIVPLRVARGVILLGSRACGLAAAVQAAARSPEPPIRRKVHVLSISMGRRQRHKGLEEAVRLAESRGLIVVAAAGQEAGFRGGGVKYPARYDPVLAVSASNVDARPWHRAGSGRSVDITAPGQGVWRANVSDAFTSGTGNGTSFSTAFTAGVAALWLDYWGYDWLVERYRGPALVASAFRYSVEHFGHRSPRRICAQATQEGWANARKMCDLAAEAWPSSKFGPGILDAAGLFVDESGAPRVLPSYDELCDHVKRTRPRDAADLCQGRVREATRVSDGTPLGRVSSFTFGGAYGQPLGASVSGGVILAGHACKLPKGLLLQAELGTKGVKAALGWAAALDYSPFGSTVGVAAKAIFIQRDDRSQAAGLELELGGLKGWKLLPAGLKVRLDLARDFHGDWDIFGGVGLGF